MLHGVDLRSFEGHYALELHRFQFNLTCKLQFAITLGKKQVSGLSFEVDWFTQKNGTKVMIQHRNPNNMAKTDSCFLMRPNSKTLKRNTFRNLYIVLSPITFRVGERATTETYWPQPESRRTCAWTTKSSAEMRMLAVVHTIRCPSIGWKATWRYVAVMSMEFQRVWEALLE